MIGSPILSSITNFPWRPFSGLEIYFNMQRYSWQDWSFPLNGFPWRFWFDEFGFVETKLTKRHSFKSTSCLCNASAVFYRMRCERASSQANHRGWWPGSRNPWRNVFLSQKRVKTGIPIGITLKEFMLWSDASNAESGEIWEYALFMKQYWLGCQRVHTRRPWRNLSVKKRRR